MPEETGVTFRENALLKARSVCLQTGLAALADDSGLEVQALHGAPGVYSARYAGVGATDEENCSKLLRALSGTPSSKRRARFVCALALYMPDGTCVEAQGTCSGEIGQTPIGTGGFGYDPLFYYEPLQATFAELSLEQKNAVSHRARAIANLQATLQGQEEKRG